MISDFFRKINKSEDGFVTGDDRDYFAAVSSSCERMMNEAIEQYNSEDHTPLSEPIKYNVLWLAFTHVTYEYFDYRMNDFDRGYLKDVTLNFMKSVEKITDHNLEITVDLRFIEEPVPLTKLRNDGPLYLASETVYPLVEKCISDLRVDTIFTTIQTRGKDNIFRNALKRGFRDDIVALGLATANISDVIPYSTFDLTIPKEGSYPLEDPDVPSLYATAVAVHEWMHQFECLGKILGIDYPRTHAYQGPRLYPGYKEYISDENDYDYFEFYKLVLKGRLPYTVNGITKHVGMYPKMWPLIKRNLFNVGYFTIQEKVSNCYLTGQSNEPRLTVSEYPCVWVIRYNGNGRYILSPKDIPNMRIDLNNAWDTEGNMIGLQYPTDHPLAQNWYLKMNIDGSYSIQTVYDSGRVINVRENKDIVLGSLKQNECQRWIINKWKEDSKR